MTDPDLTPSIEALSGPASTPDEREVAELLAELDELHTQTGRTCSGCAEPWPCDARLYAEDMAITWVDRAANRVLSRYFPKPAPAPRPVRCCPDLLCEHVFRTASRRTA